jgi:hypothetical protein
MLLLSGFFRVRNFWELTAYLYLDRPPPDHVFLICNAVISRWLGSPAEIKCNAESHMPSLILVEDRHGVDEPDPRAVITTPFTRSGLSSRHRKVPRGWEVLQHSFSGERSFMANIA